MMVLLAPGQKSDVESTGWLETKREKEDATKTQYTALETSHACWRREAGEGPSRALFIAGDRLGVGRGLTDRHIGPARTTHLRAQARWSRARLIACAAQTASGAREAGAGLQAVELSIVVPALHGGRRVVERQACVAGARGMRKTARTLQTRRQWHLARRIVCDARERPCVSSLYHAAQCREDTAKLAVYRPMEAFSGRMAAAGSLPHVCQFAALSVPPCSLTKPDSRRTSNQPAPLGGHLDTNCTTVGLGGYSSVRLARATSQQPPRPAASSAASWESRLSSLTEQR
ncbi:hypothetical protein K491DRAFT_186454 [Lophiostoma macrostomum CBS 122681]|uniref:Uncharacterized protein n=1 Tax=Lophiostoma macrostomum CBS 122681 TaxID=1314788 RepID=A0A6A6TTW4_9PLEO|nr:hypothetical protein K491DRAFT_186454 [Lophiostoma macrostomum CBS 122681]